MNRQVIVKELPKDTLGQEHFELTEAPMPEPGEGEALIRTILMSIDAANRAWMQGATYREAVNAGDVMHTYSIAEVVTSNDERLAPGD
ncbi:MAG: NADP-dependent oxidoreductase, partial [Pseudomonadota bacterium]